MRFYQERRSVPSSSKRAARVTAAGAGAADAARTKGRVNDVKTVVLSAHIVGDNVQIHVAQGLLRGDNCCIAG